MESENTSTQSTVLTNGTVLDTWNQERTQGQLRTFVENRLQLIDDSVELEIA